MGRTRTTAEIVRDVPKLSPNPSISLESYWRSTEKLVGQLTDPSSQAELFRAGNDDEKLFKTLFRIVSLTLETIQKHRDIGLPKYVKYAVAFRRVGLQALEETERLKGIINERAREDDARLERAQNDQALERPSSKEEEDGNLQSVGVDRVSDHGIDFEALTRSQNTPHSALQPGLVAISHNPGTESPACRDEVKFEDPATEEAIHGLKTDQMGKLEPDPSNLLSNSSAGVLGYPSVEHLQAPVTVPPLDNMTREGRTVRTDAPPTSAPPQRIQVARPVVTDHVPRPIQSFPSDDLAETDYERLKQRLELYGLREKVVRGDGNCQFRAIADQIFGDPERHREVRDRIVSQLADNEELYKDYVVDETGGYDGYKEKMSQDGSWGDHITLQAAADVFGARFSVLSSYPGDQFLINIEPKVLSTPKVFWLSFWAEVHYNSLYPGSR